MFPRSIISPTSLKTHLTINNSPNFNSKRKIDTTIHKINQNLIYHRSINGYNLSVNHKQQSFSIETTNSKSLSHSKLTGPHIRLFSTNSVKPTSDPLNNPIDQLKTDEIVNDILNTTKLEQKPQYNSPNISDTEKIFSKIVDPVNNFDNSNPNFGISSETVRKLDLKSCLDEQSIKTMQGNESIIKLINNIEYQFKQHQLYTLSPFAILDTPFVKPQSKKHTTPPTTPVLTPKKKIIHYFRQLKRFISKILQLLKNNSALTINLLLILFSLLLILHMTKFLTNYDFPSFQIVNDKKKRKSIKNAKMNGTRPVSTESLFYSGAMEALYELWVAVFVFAFQHSSIAELPIAGFLFTCFPGEKSINHKKMVEYLSNLVPLELTDDNISTYIDALKSMKEPLDIDSYYSIVKKLNLLQLVIHTLRDTIRLPQIGYFPSGHLCTVDGVHANYLFSLSTTTDRQVKLIDDVLRQICLKFNIKLLVHDNISQPYSLIITDSCLDQNGIQRLIKLAEATMSLRAELILYKQGILPLLKIYSSFNGKTLYSINQINVKQVAVDPEVEPYEYESFYEFLSVQSQLPDYFAGHFRPSDYFSNLVPFQPNLPLPARMMTIDPNVTGLPLAGTVYRDLEYMFDPFFYLSGVEKRKRFLMKYKVTFSLDRLLFGFNDEEEEVEDHLSVVKYLEYKNIVDKEGLYNTLYGIPLKNRRKWMLDILQEELDEGLYDHVGTENESSLAFYNTIRIPNEQRPFNIQHGGGTIDIVAKGGIVNIVKSWVANSIRSYYHWSSLLTGNIPTEFLMMKEENENDEEEEED